VQAGFAIQKISKEEAEKSLEGWESALRKLKAIDKKQATGQKKSGNAEFDAIISRALSGKSPSLSEMSYLLRIKDRKRLDALYSAANSLRQKKLGNACCVHGIIEFSNYCSSNCAYCGINAGNSKLKRYRMSESEILEAAEYAVNGLGFKALVLQSGEDPHYSAETLAGIVRKIRERCGAVIFVSIGEIGKKGYQQLYDAGARCSLFRFETSNERLYAKLHDGEDFAERLSYLEEMNRIGYVLATGGLVGLPGQSAEDLAQDIMLAKSLRAEMFSFGPFLPHPESGLRNEKAPAVDDALKVLAVARLASPEAKILVTTALETLDRQGRKKGLLAGANSVMINVTPMKYRRQYEIYPKRAGAEEESKKQIDETIKLLKSLGRAPTDLGITEAGKWDS
jgi:biotin synthase